MIMLKRQFYASNTNELEKIRQNLFNKILETPLFDTKDLAMIFVKL